MMLSLFLLYHSLICLQLAPVSSTCSVHVGPLSYCKLTPLPVQWTPFVQSAPILSKKRKCFYPVCCVIKQRHLFKYKIFCNGDSCKILKSNESGLVIGCKYLYDNYFLIMYKCVCMYESLLLINDTHR